MHAPTFVRRFSVGATIGRPHYITVHRRIGFFGRAMHAPTFHFRKTIYKDFDKCILCAPQNHLDYVSRDHKMIFAI